MKSTRNLPTMQLKVGTLLAVAGGVTLLALIFPTRGINPFAPHISLTAFYPNVGGLRGSSPVWFSGVEVGAVKSVAFEPGSQPPRLKVVFSIERKIQPYLHADAKAEIKSMGLLGDMYVELTPGSAAAPPLENGAVVAGVPASSATEEIGGLMAAARETLDSLKTITAEISSGQGTLGKLVTNPALYDDLQASLQDFRKFMAEVTRGGGTLNKLLTDPDLYSEMVSAIKEIRSVVAELKQAEDVLIGPETRKTVDETVKTAARVVKRVGEIEEKVDRIRFDFNFGLDKYAAPDLAGGHADLLIWPSPSRYYEFGIQKVSRLYGYEKDETTYQVQLAWQILHSPVFIRGGLIKSEYFVAGLDVRPIPDVVNLAVDAYRVEFNPIQVDLRAGVTFLNLLELSAGVENILNNPFYKAGLTIHYQDDDLLNVIFKTKF